MKCIQKYLLFELVVDSCQTARLLDHPEPPRRGNGQGVFFNQGI